MITQLFFHNQDYFELREFLARHGVTTPVVPGIFPVLTRSQVNGFVTACGARKPPELESALREYGDDDNAVTEWGIDYATRQCDELLREARPAFISIPSTAPDPTMEVVRRLSVGAL